MKFRKALENAGAHLAIARPPSVVFRLFIAETMTKSPEAVVQKRQLCEAPLENRCELEVSMICRQLMMARPNQMVVIPNLINDFPCAFRRFIGNLLKLSTLSAELGTPSPGEVVF